MFLAVIAACGSSSDPKAKPEGTPQPTQTPVPAAAVPSVKKPADEMDERMRHCPVALDGATSTLADIAGGVRFTIKVPDAAIDEARRRAHHIVDFAAKKTREGHGDFDGKGGGRMKNCPVVTDGVTITAIDIPGGAQLDVIAVGDVAQLRAETRARTASFPFVGATIKIADPR